MSSIAQANPITQPLFSVYGQPGQRSSSHQTTQRYAQSYVPPFPPEPTQGPPIHQRAAEIALVLHPAECRVLMDAVAPLLFAQTDPYVPPRGEPERIAQVLTSHYGLLTPERAGYVGAYRPTLLGVAVIWLCLLHDLQARPGGDAYAG